MIDGKNYKELKKEERDKWKKLDKKQKWCYFKDYYLWKVLVTLAVLACLVSFLLEAFVFRKEPVYTGCLLNFEPTMEGEEFLTSGYYQYLGGGKKKYIPKTAVCYIQFKDTEQVMDAQNDTEILFAQFATKEYDYILMTDDSLEAIEELEIYADLSEVLSDRWYGRLKDRILYAKIKEQEEPIPAVIDISGTETAKQLGFGEDERLYLAFAVNTGDAGKIEQFLDYILNDLKEKEDAGI